MDFKLESINVTAENNQPDNRELPPYVEQGFRWMRETIELVYEKHRHPLPMTALIFMYAETLGKPLAGHTAGTKKKVAAFVEAFLPDLWSAFSWAGKDRAEILGNYYRCGLAHQMFMKKNAGIHENASGIHDYVSQDFPGIPYSINIDCLVPEFLEGISRYYARLQNDTAFSAAFLTELPKEQWDA